VTQNGQSPAAARKKTQGPAKSEHGPVRKYQSSDIDIVDYQYEVLDGCSFAVRGPLSGNPSAKNIVCLGSAATFGRFAKKPFPAVLAERLGVHVMNFGIGGARPETYLKEPELLKKCRQSDLIILELMSARSYESDLFIPGGHQGKTGRVGPRYAEQIAATGDRVLLEKPIVSADQLYKWAVGHLDEPSLAEIRRQILDCYVRDAQNLIEQVQKPVILLWLSQRSMDEVPERESYRTWARGFPHFVDRQAVEAIETRAVGLVNVTSSAGIPSPLISFRTGEPVSIRRERWKPTTSNSYYPSPEMHLEAAEKILTFLETLPGNSWARSAEPPPAGLQPAGLQ